MRHFGCYSLVLALLAGAGSAWGQEELVHRLDRRSQWEQWTFPPGLIDFQTDGSLTLAKFEDEVNAVLGADQFTHVVAGDKEVQGGVWRVGSTAPGANIAPENIIDGDPETWWKPDPDAPLKHWYIEVDLGRAVPVTKIRLIFPDTTGARPLRDFRVYGTRGYREKLRTDLFSYTVLGGTTRHNDQTVMDFELAPSRSLTTRVVGPGIGEATAPSFLTLQYIRIRVDAKSPDAALAEMEVHTFGENISLEALSRGGSILEQSGRGTVLVDGDFNTAWAQKLTDQKVVWFLDLGARYWTKHILLLGGEKGGYGVGTEASDHLLLTSPEGARLEPDDVKFEVLHEFDRDEGSGDLHYILPSPVPLRYLMSIYERSSNEIAEIMVIPTGHVAGVEMESGFIDLGAEARRQGGTQGSKQILRIDWEADVPEGTRVEVRTRTGHQLTPKVDYYSKTGALLADKAAYDKLNKFTRGRTDTFIVAGDDWSAWSGEYPESGLFLSPSPRSLLQIQAILISDQPEVAPTLKALDVVYVDALIRGIQGEIYPKSAEPGVPQTLTYKLWGDFAEGGSFDRFLFATPSRVDPDSVLVKVGGTEVAAIVEVATTDSLGVRLPAGEQVDAAADTVEVEMRGVRIHRNPTLIKAFVGHTETPELWQEVVPGGKISDATQVFFTKVPRSDRLLGALSVQPRIITPNGDGVGDRAQIRFQVLNVSVEPVVGIYTLDGGLVQELKGGQGPDGSQLYTWDGRDRSGGLVPPGIYLYRVRLPTQSDEQQITGILGLAY